MSVEPTIEWAMKVHDVVGCFVSQGIQLRLAREGGICSLQNGQFIGRVGLTLSRDDFANPNQVDTDRFSSIVSVGPDFPAPTCEQGFIYATRELAEQLAEHGGVCLSSHCSELLDELEGSK
jgi:hypothetical protein